MGDSRLSTTSSASVAVEEIVRPGVCDMWDVEGIAARRNNEVGILGVNSQDGAAVAEQEVRHAVKGLLRSVSHVRINRHAVDGTHSNFRNVRISRGEPQQSTHEQYAKLQAAGKLQKGGSQEWASVARRAMHQKFGLQREAASLVRVAW